MPQFIPSTIYIKVKKNETDSHPKKKFILHINSQSCVTILTIRAFIGLDNILLQCRISEIPEIDSLIRVQGGNIFQATYGNYYNSKFVKLPKMPKTDKLTMN